MGLGKTLTMISLILKASENSRDLSEDSNESDTTFDDSPRNSMCTYKFYFELDVKCFIFGQLLKVEHL